MSTQTLYKWGAITTIVTALVFTAAAIAVAIVPDGGLANPVAPTLYYLGLILSVPTYTTIYSAQAKLAGKLGFAGFGMSTIGSILYSGPAYVLVAGTSGVETWHDVWGFAMGNVLPLGASIFLIGSILLGVATMRAKVFSRNAGLMLVIGSFLWLVAFYIPIPYLLSIANLTSAAGLSWIAASLLPRSEANVLKVQQPTQSEP